MITDAKIEAAKSSTSYSTKNRRHEHNDCIRIAYEWLDAQVKIQNPNKKTYALKHIVERWAGRYVSQSDVEVAAHMHPLIHGTYPYFNISARLTRPSKDRLSDIGEAFTQQYSENARNKTYFRHE
jgi:hypothetical protein